MSKSVFCTATASQTDTIVRNLKTAGFSVQSDDSDETERAKENFEQGGAKDITSAGELAVSAGNRA